MKLYTKVVPHRERSYKLVHRDVAAGIPDDIVMPAKTQYVSENFAQRIALTKAQRKHVRRDLRPLFDHIIRLALNSYRHGSPDYAGIELRKARQLVKYTRTRRSR